MRGTGIGLFPDVGSTHVLSRVRGGSPIGLYIGKDTGFALRSRCLRGQDTAFALRFHCLRS